MNVVFSYYKPSESQESTTDLVARIHMIANSFTCLPHAAATLFLRSKISDVSLYVQVVLLGGKKAFHAGSMAKRS